MTSFINDNGQEIQIKDEVLVTKQVASFKNFKIKGDVSVSFSVANNSVNRSALGYYGTNQLNSPVFSSIPFNMVQNGNLLMRGKMVIEEDTGDELLLYFISGNSDWFGLLSFNLRELRNTNFATEWSLSGLQNRVGAVDGIVFPVIDWIYKGQKVDNYITDALTPGFGGDIDFNIYEYFPCVYVHSLLDQVSNFSGIKINGSLLNDKFFNSLIITPSSPDIYDPETQQLLLPGDIVKIEAIAPDMKAIDFVKWICVTFSVIPVYDTFSGTLTLDLLDKKVLTGDDWSDYVQEYQVKFDQVQNNYIRLPEGDEVFDSYNETRETKFGEVNLETDKTDGQDKELYQSPFAACYDSVSDTQKFAVPFIPMYDLEDEEEYFFNSVGQRAIIGTAEFNGVGFPFDSNSDKFIIRIDGGNYTGYHKAFTYAGVFPSNTKVNTYTDFNLTANGWLYTQRVSKGNPGPRVLSFIPSITSTDYNSLNIFIGDPSDYDTLSTSATAYYYKPWYPLYPVLNRYRQGLSYGYVDNYNDFSIESMYYNYLRGMITSPTIRTKMLLPEAVFSAFNFQFIYLNTGRLNGYYFVESIVNYKDSTTLCEVNLLELTREQEEAIPDQVAYNLVINKASFLITTYDITLTYEALIHAVSMDTTTITGSAVWSTSFANDLETINLSTTGTATDTGELSYDGNVIATVSRVGVTSDNTVIYWYKNVTLMATENIGIGLSVNTSYTYTGLVGGEDLSTIIEEG